MLRMICKILVVAMALMSLVVGCDDARSPAPAKSPAPASTMPAAEGQVTIDNFSFTPATLTVASGKKVTWTNRDDVPHTATSGSKPRVFDSKALDTDETFSHVFTQPGEYDYFCAVHPHMTGKIIVK